MLPVGLPVGISPDTAARSHRGGRGEMGRENADPQGTDATSPASPQPPQARPGVILTPDQRVRVFISSTLEELAGERVAARRAIVRLHLVPVWYESGARPHQPRSMYRAYLEQSGIESINDLYWLGRREPEYLDLACEIRSSVQ